MVVEQFDDTGHHRTGATGGKQGWGAIEDYSVFDDLIFINKRNIWFVCCLILFYCRFGPIELRTILSLFAFLNFILVPRLKQLVQN